MHTAASAGDDVKNLGGEFLENASTQFHTYSIEWYKDKMVFSVDEVVHYVYEPSERDSETWPFTTDQYLLLNIAIESDIDPSFEESAMVVDYIRVYQ